MKLTDELLKEIKLDNGYDCSDNERAMARELLELHKKLYKYQNMFRPSKKPRGGVK